MHAPSTAPLIALAGLLLLPALTACVAVNTSEVSDVQPSETATQSLSHRLPLDLGPEPEPWTPTDPMWEGLPSRPIGPAEYAATYLDDDVDVSSDTILNFYRSAAVAFPFPLPDGYSFPVTPSPNGLPRTTDYPAQEIATVAIRTYFEYANAEAARVAFERDDTATATRHFDLIQQAYLSAANLIDGGEDTPARRYHAAYDRFRAGDFAEWGAHLTNPFFDTVD